MASDNLNRVFIKAYGKDKAAGHRGSPTAAAINSPSTFIVRFDTATVETESPHLLSRPTSTQENQLPTQTHKPTQRKPSVSVAAVAKQPSSASMQVPRPVDSPSASIRTIPNAMDHTTIVVSQSGTGRTDASEAAPADPYSTSQIAAQLPTRKSANDEQPRQAFNSDRGAGSTTEASYSISSVVDNSIGMDLADRIAAKNRGGDIFRLDRPSYAEPAHEGDLYADSDSSQPSLSMDSVAGKVQSVPTTPDSFTRSDGFERGRRSDSLNHNVTNPSRESEQIRHKERSLRMARLRIFNPLWEVDRLEWPPICQELIESINIGSASVAQNLLSACQEGLQVLAVTSPQSGTGTSTVACCLAMLAGRNGLNVALVDGNTENPSLCYQTNLDLEVDWHEAVAKQLPLEEIAVHSVDDQVTLVPLLERLNAPELNEQNMASMLQELSQSFDMVIVDLGTMSSPRNMVNSLGELGVIHAVVAVLDKRNCSSDRTESCLRQIRQTGIASIGLVENFAA